MVRNGQKRISIIFAFYWLEHLFLPLTKSSYNLNFLNCVLRVKFSFFELRSLFSLNDKYIEISFDKQMCFDSN